MTAPKNFWLEGETALVTLPEIKSGLKNILKHHPELKSVYAAKKMPAWKKQPDGFEGLINIILAQQISTAVASHLVARLKILMPEITPRRFLKLEDENLRAIGISRQKIAYGRNLAEQITTKKFNPVLLADIPEDDAMKTLTDLKGFGPWSAEIYLMFSLGRGDVWPAGDIALQKGIQKVLALKDRPSPKQTRELGARWMPHRSAASLIVWRA